jgi:hypothetical protein
VTVGAARWRIRSLDAEALRLRFVREVPEAPDPSRRTLEIINRLRGLHGLPPAALDAVLSRGCSAHARYLVKNGWNGFTNPHFQDPRGKEASEEGARAAQRSVISRISPETSIPGYWVTYYHRIGLASPGLERVGVNDEFPAVSVIDVAQAHEGRGDGAWPWRDPVTVPADGSAEVPTASGGELPREPVPNLARRGFPLMAFFRDPGSVSGFGGTLERRGKRGWEPEKVLVADPGDHRGILGLVPDTALRANSTYRATLEWTRDDRRESAVVEFDTL